eukprot:gene42207-20398_t
MECSKPHPGAAAYWVNLSAVFGPGDKVVAGWHDGGPGPDGSGLQHKAMVLVLLPDAARGRVQFDIEGTSGDTVLAASFNVTFGVPRPPPEEGDLLSGGVLPPMEPFPPYGEPYDYESELRRHRASLGDEEGGIVIVDGPTAGDAADGAAR